MNRYSYKNLNVYQDAKAFVVAVYKLLDRFPDSEKFAYAIRFVVLQYLLHLI